MSFVCQISGKKPVSGNNVSHSKRRTKRRFMPNLYNVSLFSEILNKTESMRISKSLHRTILFKQGIDNYILKCKNSRLVTPFAKKLKKRLLKILAKKEAISITTPSAPKPLASEE